MAVQIVDEYFERKAEAERLRRGHKSLAKTVRELTEERLIEIQMGQYLPPAPEPEGQQFAPTTATRLPAPPKGGRPLPQ